MADYRGDGYAHQSGANAQYVDDMRKGQTPGQQRRALRNKAIIAGLQAGMMGIAGAINKDQADKQDTEDKRKIMAKAIANAKNQAGMRADGTYGGASAGGPSAHQGLGYSAAAQWMLNQSVADGQNPQSPKAPSMEGETAPTEKYTSQLSAMDANKEASAVNPHQLKLGIGRSLAEDYK